MNDLARAIGSRIKEERQRLGLNQTNLGALVGVKKDTVLIWEKGDTFPNILQAKKLAEYGLDLDYVLQGGKPEITASLSINKRLKEERSKLMSQQQAADIVSVSRKTFSYWEKDSGTAPNANQLSILFQHGFDINYIVTGLRARKLEDHQRTDSKIKITLSIQCGDQEQACDLDIEKGVQHG